MNTQEVLDSQQWAEQTFGGVQLHDMRRTRRAVQAASKLAENPLDSLPAQMQTWKETKALYRLLDEPDVTFAALMQPHLHQTREQANSSPVVLMVQDTTDIDLSHRRHPSVAWGKSGAFADGAFSSKRCWLYDHRTVRCLDAWLKNPDVAYSSPRRRTTASPIEAANTRNRCLDPPGQHDWDACLRPASGSMWEIGVRICSRSAEACQATQTHFLVRAGKSRRVQEHEAAITYELPRARAFKSQASRPGASPSPAWARSRVGPSCRWPLVR